MAQQAWYSGRKFSKADITSMAVCILLAVLSLGITLFNGSRYFNPFT